MAKMGLVLFSSFFLSDLKHWVPTAVESLWGIYR
jgi:hypothetical protein